MVRLCKGEKMNIEFEDKSFMNLSIVDGKLRITLCGIKSKYERTMVSVDLDMEQVGKILSNIKNFADGKLIMV